MTATTATPRQSAVLWATVAAVLVSSAWVLSFSGRLLVADLAIHDTRKQVLRCDALSAGWAPAQWQALQADLEWGLQLTPGDAVKHDLLGQLHACHGTLVWDAQVLRQYHYTLAWLQHDASLRLRPGHATTLTRLALAIQVSGGAQSDVNSVWADALHQGRHVQTNHPALAYVVLSAWDGATPQMQAWVQSVARVPVAADGQWVRNMAESLGVQDKLP